MSRLILSFTIVRIKKNKHLHNLICVYVLSLSHEHTVNCFIFISMTFPNVLIIFLLQGFVTDDIVTFGCAMFRQIQVCQLSSMKQKSFPFTLFCVSCTSMHGVCGIGDFSMHRRVQVCSIVNFSYALLFYAQACGVQWIFPMHFYAQACVVQCFFFCALLCIGMCSILFFFCALLCIGGFGRVEYIYVLENTQLFEDIKYRVFNIRSDILLSMYFLLVYVGCHPVYPGAVQSSVYNTVYSNIYFTVFTPFERVGLGCEQVGVTSLKSFIFMYCQLLKSWKTFKNTLSSSRSFNLLHGDQALGVFNVQWFSRSHEVQLPRI